MRDSARVEAFSDGVFAIVRAARATRLRFGLGLIVYPLTVALAFASAVLALALHGLLAVYYAFNQTPVPTRQPGSAEPK